jgi:tetratricopeptide (TPR) repeat protein
LNNLLGNAYSCLEKRDSALFYYNRALEVVSVINDQYYEGWKIPSVYNLAEFYYSNKDYDVALGYLKKMELMNDDDELTFSEENDNMTDFPIKRAILFCKIYLAQNNTDSIMRYVRIIEPLTSSFRNLKDSIDAIDGVETLVKVYTNKNIKDSILKYQSLLISLKDAAFNQTEIKKLESIKYNEKQKDIEIEERKQQVEKERNKNIKLGLISIFIPTFAALVFYLSRKKKKNTKIITLMGLASLLMLFEFISLLIHPFIEKITHHDPVLMYLILLLIASILVPIHHKLEGWIKEKI